MADDEIITLGAANLRQRTRTNKSGATRQRYTVEVSGDSLLASFDPAALGKPVAEAIQAVYQERIANISARAPEATIKARQVAARAFAAGKAWAQARYQGGRTGALAPNQSDRVGTDSGRFARTITVAANGAAWTINVAANRLHEATSGGVDRVWQAIVRHVPELADTKRLLDDLRVRRAIKDTTAAAIQKVNDRTIELKRQRMQAGIGLIRAVVGL